MSRSQWIVIALLGLGVVLVFACLGGVALTYPTWQVRTQTPDAVQAVDTPTLSPTPTPSPTAILPTATPEPPTPTNTRVIPLTTPTPVPPTATSTAYPTHTPYPTYTPQPAPTAPPIPTSPPAPPPAPTVDTYCVDVENAYHQQMLAYIEARYAPTLSWIEYQIEQATRDRDWRRIRDLQQQYQMYQNMKAADINAENARHQAALAACR